MIQTASSTSEHNYFQDAFWNELVQMLIRELDNHFQDRLISVYVTGSVHRQEAVIPQPLGSDLDLAVIIRDQFNPEDKAWRNQINDELHEQVPGLPWSIIPRAYSLAMVDLSKSEQYADTVSQALDIENAGGDLDPAMTVAITKRACYYQFKYDATLVFGRDLTESIYVPKPDRIWAKMLFQQPWDLVRHTAGLKPGSITKNTQTNISEWPLPEPLDMKLRKLARLGVLGASCLMMACGDFKSFRGADVIPFAKASLPEWQGFLETTEASYLFLPKADAKSIAEYLPHLVGWMEKIGSILWAGVC